MRNPRLLHAKITKQKSAVHQFGLIIAAVVCCQGCKTKSEFSALTHLTSDSGISPSLNETFQAKMSLALSSLEKFI